MTKYRVYAKAMGSTIVEAKDHNEAIAKACNCDIEDLELQWDYQAEEEKKSEKDG